MVGKFARAAAPFAFLAAFGAQQAQALTINDYFDISITSDPNAALIEQAITDTTSSIARLYSNPVTVGIYFQQQAGSFLGSSESTFYFWDTTNYNAAAAAASAANPSNLNLAQGLANLSSGNGYADTNLILTGTALRAIGIDAPGAFDTSGAYTGAGAVDTIITLTSSYPLDYNVNVPAYDGTNLTYNARDTIAHEVFEALGIGGSGSNLNFIYDLQNGATFGDAATDAFVLSAVGLLDRYRYSAPGVASFSTDPTDTAYLSLDGGATNIATFNQYHQGDFGDLGPTVYSCGSAGGHGGPIGQIQDAFSCYNEPTTTPTLNSAEGVAMQAIGWNPAPEPASWTLMALGVAGLGAALRRRRTLPI